MRLSKLYDYVETHGVSYQYILLEKTFESTMTDKLITFIHVLVYQINQLKLVRL